MELIEEKEYNKLVKKILRIFIMLKLYKTKKSACA